VNIQAANLVKQQHEVYEKGNGKRQELHCEKVSRQKADDLLDVFSKVDGGDGRRLSLGGLGGHHFVDGGHGSGLAGVQDVSRT
jgi:hypothetical protein